MSTDHFTLLYGTTLASVLATSVLPLASTAITKVILHIYHYILRWMPKSKKVTITFRSLTNEHKADPTYTIIQSFISLEENKKFIDGVDLELKQDQSEGSFLSPVEGSRFDMTLGNISFNVVVGYDYNVKTKELEMKVSTLKLITKSSEEAVKLVNDIKDVVTLRQSSLKRAIYDWEQMKESYKNSEWRQRPMDQNRTFHTIQLKNQAQKELMNDLDQFIKGQNDYHDLGIMWKRGYLFHGPPGTGKSSLSIAIANVIQWPIYVIDLTGEEDKQEIVNMFREIPARAIVLLEEIDTVPQARKREFQPPPTPPKDEYYRVKKTPWQLGTLLNVIDGIMSSPSRIVIMTTNHIEMLDSALIRPGRIDVSMLLDNCDGDQLCRIYEAFFPNTMPLLLNTTTLSQTVSPATVSGICTRFRNDPEKARAAILELV